MYFILKSCVRMKARKIKFEVVKVLQKKPVRFYNKMWSSNVLELKIRSFKKGWDKTETKEASFFETWSCSKSFREKTTEVLQ